jgi:ribosomal protein L30/L7E
MVTPRYEDIAVKYLTENLTVKELLNRAVKRIGVTKDQLKVQDRRIFIEDPDKQYKEEKDWVRKGNRLYLVQPDEFCYLDESLPTQVKELVELYKSVQDKCIVTARPQSMRNKIESVLKQFGLENPKWGVHMCPNSRMNAGKWKGEKIVELVKLTGFNNVIFYDDNSKYIRGAKQVVSEKLPDLNFKCIKVV